MTKKLLLLVNLGSPKSTDPNDVGVFLDEFLMDPLVINIPKPLRWLLVKKLIVPRRKHNSAEAYSEIWMEKEGSPLVHYTEKLTQKMNASLDGFQVDFAMRYNGPSIDQLLNQYKDMDEIYVLPIYPQYAESSSETVLVEVQKYVQEKNPTAKVFKIDYFFEKKQYLDSLTLHIQDYLKDKEIDHILFSYHGLPENHIKKLGPDYKANCLKTDCCPNRFGKKNLCYRSHCFETTALIKERLGLDSNISTSTSFQSRLGRAEWIKPYTTAHIDELVKEQNIKKLAVVSPSFIADCLETLEEIDMQLREQFVDVGGDDFYYIPALNDSDKWVKSFNNLISESHNTWDLVQAKK